jgi:serralysin
MCNDLLKRLTPVFVRALLSLVLSLSLILVSPVETNLSAGAMRARGRQTSPGIFSGSVGQFNLAPVAVNDGGPGFITFKNRPFITRSVLANDFDPDGDILFVKSFDDSGTKGLVNYLPGGSLDTTFGSGGKVTTDLGGFYYSGAVLVQPDNKILVAGDLYIYTSQGPIIYGIALARYNSNGSPDVSFNTTGVVTTTFVGDATGTALALQPDGKIVVAGGLTTAPHSNYSLFRVDRYNLDGSPDRSFGLNGVVTTDFGGGGAFANAITLQLDGKIIVAGWAYTGAQGSDYHDFAIARYNPDGSPDVNFGSEGKIITSFGNSSGIIGVTLQPDYKIVVVGFSGNWPSSDFALARYNSDGSLDKSFRYSGLFTTRFGGDSWGRAVVVQPNGKILVAGDAKPNPSVYYVFALARYNPDGSLDTNFDQDGLVTTDFGQSAVGQSLVLQPDGKIIVAGNIYNGAVYDYGLTRYGSDGSLDTSFDGDGMVTTPFGDAYYRVSTALQPDGKIVLAGSVDHTFALARYNPGGTFRYDPNRKFDSQLPGEEDFDTFTYTASDGVLTDTATVTITVISAVQVFLPVLQ